MKQLYYPIVVFNICFKNRETKQIKIKKSHSMVYRELPSYNCYLIEPTIEQLDRIMYKYPSSFIYYPHTFFKRNYKKQISFYEGSDGYYLKDIMTIAIEETYEICNGENIRYITQHLTSDEFFDYLHDKEQKLKDIVNFIE